MFTTPYLQAKRSLDSLKTSLKFNSGLRSAIAAGVLQLPDTIGPPPPSDGWCREEHCAVVTRLYSIYECMVHELITEWLELFSSHTKYSALPERMARVHRNGIGRILSNYDGGRRFRGLSLPTIIAEFGKALTDAPNYGILPAAFLHHDRNLRLNELVELLSDCGLTTEIAPWMKDNPDLRKHHSASPLNVTPEKAVADLIDYRNDAAHAGGDVDDILGEATLIAYIEYFECIFGALYQAFCSAGLDVKLVHDNWNKVGKVTGLHRTDPTICIVALQAGTFRLGTKIYLRGKRCCFPAVVQSIQLDGQQREAFTCVDDREIGLKLDVSPTKGLELFARADVSALGLADPS